MLKSPKNLYDANMQHFLKCVIVIGFDFSDERTEVKLHGRLSSIYYIISSPKIKEMSSFLSQKSPYSSD